MRLDYTPSGSTAWQQEPDDLQEPIHPQVEARLRQIIRQELAREMAALRRLATGVAPEPRWEAE